MPVAWSWAVTFAPEMMAPDGSVTSPLMDPRPAWARETTALDSSTAPMKDLLAAEATIALRFMCCPQQKNSIQTFES